MELRHLRYFVAVGEELHFGRAAARLHIVQPALSRQMRALEEEMGLRLFERNRRRVALTPAGRVFLDEARALLGHVDRAVEAARRAARGELGSLRIGYVPAMASTGLPETLGTRCEREAANGPRRRGPVLGQPAKPGVAEGLAALYTPDAGPAANRAWAQEMRVRSWPE